MKSEDRAGLRRLLAVASRVGQVLVGLLLGFLVGLATTLSLMIIRAHLLHVFVHSTEDVVGWLGAPIVLFALGGGWIGFRGGAIFRRTLRGAVLGLFSGILLGIALGFLGGQDWLKWAGATVGAAIGMFVGAMGGVVRGRRLDRESRSAEVAGTGSAAVLLLSALPLLLAGCGGEVDGTLPDPGVYEGPDTSRVESVVFLVGDPGMATMETYPVISRVREEVDTWARVLDRDSAVAMVVLGDIIYPNGMHARDEPEYPQDSARVTAQVSMVAGPEAVRRQALGLFVAGNHDWGQERHLQGVHRLERLQIFLDEWRKSEAGPSVELLPEAGTGGPAVVDMGDHLRLVLLDTAWWLLEADLVAKRQVIRGVAAALRDAGERQVVIAAHHPFASGGPHGDLAVLGGTLGLRTLLARSGAMLQDLTSPPYRDLIRQLTVVFAAHGRPAVFAGGHEHSLQVIRHDAAGAPHMSVVSGSASKLTPVGPAEGMVFARAAPGFTRVFVMTDGSLLVSVAAAPPEYLSCPEDRPDPCLGEGVGAYRTVWAGPVSP